MRPASRSWLTMTTMTTRRRCGRLSRRRPRMPSPTTRPSPRRARGAGSRRAAARGKPQQSSARTHARKRFAAESSACTQLCEHLFYIRVPRRWPDDRAIPVACGRPLTQRATARRPSARHVGPVRGRDAHERGTNRGSRGACAAAPTERHLPPARLLRAAPSPAPPAAQLRALGRADLAAMRCIRGARAAAAAISRRGGCADAHQTAAAR